jgi:beta-glucanase (GH16 family)
MKKISFGLLLLIFFTSSISAQCPKLVWSDEFDGSTLNSANWSYEIGDACDQGFCGWGNNELQYYRSQNTSVKDGFLTITARKESFGSRQYTSSRIRTKNLVDIKYGRIEARMKMPIGRGIWPAFWMLPTENIYGGWPKSGEIDIMEYLGHEPQKIHGTLHYGQDSPNNRSTSASFTTNGKGFNEDFHDYAIEWNATSIKWYIDGYLYSTKTTQDLGGSFWPFIQKFHLLLNLAVGGNWPGSPDFSTVFPQEYIVDYVRVYDLVDQPYLSGNQSAESGSAQGYLINNAKANTTYTWTVPADVKILSGQGTNALNVQWGPTSGKIIVEVKNDCGTRKYSLDVKSLAPLASGLIFENFDSPAKITKTFSTGVLTEKKPNPSKDATNGSALVGEYKRNGPSQYDVLVYDVKDIKDAAEYVNGQKVFAIDVYTTAPINTEILLQMENKARSAGNYPVGRHSRFTATTKKRNEWHKLYFTFLDKPDNGTANTAIDQFVFLFAPNGNTSDTYYWDNFESLQRTPTNNISTITAKIFPNPSFDFINITSEEAIHTVEIFNTAGSLVHSETNKQTSIRQCSVASLQNGIYVVKMYSDKGSAIQKIEVIK